MKFEAAVPMSATLMLSYIMGDNGTTDGAAMEVAAALLTNPTNDENFSLNFEISFVDVEAEFSGEAADEDAFGIYVEMLAVIP